MATIFKQKGRNTFYLSYLINKVRKTINTGVPVTMPREAVDFKKEFEAKLLLLNKNTSSFYSKDSKLTLGEAIEKFIEVYGITWSQGRFKNVSSTLKIMREILGADTLISKIDTPSLSKYVAQRKLDQKSTTTIRTDLQIIRMFFNSLIEEEIISRTPLNKRLIPKPEKNEIIVLAPSETNLIFAKALETDPLFYKYLGILYLTGIRPGDGINLTFGNIKTEAQSINITISKTKNVLIFPLYSALLNFITLEFTDFKDRLQSEKLFPEYKKHTVGRKFKRLKKELKLNNKYNLKSFRKTFATYLANNEFENSMVSYLLGHTTSGTADKFYIKKNFDLLRKKMDKLDFNLMEGEKSANGLLTE